MSSSTVTIRQGTVGSVTADDALSDRRIAPSIETVTFTTGDGVELHGDLATTAAPGAAAIVCHPHPQYGGNRFNNVVEALFETLPLAGVTALRFDFRTEFGGGVAEQGDATAAIDFVSDSAANVPVFAVGYSFGAMVALALSDHRLAGKALVAPPLGAMDIEPGTPCPTLVLTPAHDQFAPPATAEPIVTSWSDSAFETIDSVDHFIAGRTALVAERVAAWITSQVGYIAPGAM